MNGTVSEYSFPGVDGDVVYEGVDWVNSVSEVVA